MNAADAAHDRPTADEMVTAVREWLDGVASGTVDSNPFHARVAAAMLAMVERQNEVGDQIAADHAERLDRLGVADEAELAALIRAGELDGRLDEVRAVVLATVRDKLRVANPRYLERVDSATLLSGAALDGDGDDD